MYQFKCGSPVCKTHFAAATKDELMREVAHHVATTHRISNPSASLVRYIEENTVSEAAPAGEAG